MSRRYPTKFALLRSELLELRATETVVCRLRVEVRSEVVERPPPAPPPWHRWAACRGKPTAWWFPGKDDVWLTRAAVAVCEGCGVRERCLQAALAEEAELGAIEVCGIRGGLLPSQRLALAGRGRRVHAR